VIAEAQTAISDLVGGEPSGVFFAPSSTSVTYRMSRTLANRYACTRCQLGWHHGRGRSPCFTRRQCNWFATLADSAINERSGSAAAAQQKSEGQRMFMATTTLGKPLPRKVFAIAEVQYARASCITTLLPMLTA